MRSNAHSFGARILDVTLYRSGRHTHRIEITAKGRFRLLDHPGLSVSAMVAAAEKIGDRPTCACMRFITVFRALPSPVAQGRRNRSFSEIINDIRAVEFYNFRVSVHNTRKNERSELEAHLARTRVPIEELFEMSQQIPGDVAQTNMGRDPTEIDNIVTKIMTARGWSDAMQKKFWRILNERQPPGADVATRRSFVGMLRKG